MQTDHSYLTYTLKGVQDKDYEHDQHFANV
jgi:hypothetical protein